MVSWYFIILREGIVALKKELKVKTLFDAVVEWYKIKPEIFNETPDVFRAKAYKIIGTTDI